MSDHVCFSKDHIHSNDYLINPSLSLNKRLNETTVFISSANCSSSYAPRQTPHVNSFHSISMQPSRWLSTVTIVLRAGSPLIQICNIRFKKMKKRKNCASILLIAKHNIKNAVHPALSRSEPVLSLYRRVMVSSVVV